MSWVISYSHQINISDYNTCIVFCFFCGGGGGGGGSKAQKYVTYEYSVVAILKFPVSSRLS